MKSEKKPAKPLESKAAKKSPAPSRSAAATSKPKSVKAASTKPAAAVPPQVEPGRSRIEGLAVPSILLEGDHPTLLMEAGPGRRFALAPFSSSTGSMAIADETELPLSYGTGEVFLTARDPHCLHAAWDLSPEEQQRLNVRSSDGHLILKLLAIASPEMEPEEIHLHPESRHWFIHVRAGGGEYQVELGYRGQAKAWVHLGMSEPVVTPRDSVVEPPKPEPRESAPTAVPATAPARLDAPAVSAVTFVPPPTPTPTIIFATLPPHSEHKVVETPVSTAPSAPVFEEPGNVNRAEALPPEPAPTPKNEPSRIQAPARYHVGDVDWNPGPSRSATPPFVPEPPRPQPAASFHLEPAAVPSWTEAQSSALAEIVSTQSTREVWFDSLSLLESTQTTSGARSSRPGVPSDTSPSSSVVSEFSPEEQFGGLSSGEFPERGRDWRRSFWFNVNAELVIYGATEVDAEVRIGGRPIRLRADGSFSFRFSLPDGDYDLDVNAKSADGAEWREARLAFGRRTEFRGEVTAHPQDPALKPPLVENVG